MNLVLASNYRLFRLYDHLDRCTLFRYKRLSESYTFSLRDIYVEKGESERERGEREN